MHARLSPQFRRSLALLLVAAHCGSPLSALAAAAPAPARSGARATTPAYKPPVLVSRALGLYQQARYDEAVTLLLGPVTRGEFKGADLREARIVLARCYVKKGLENRANEHFKAILAAEPAFELDATRADAEELAAFRAIKPAASPEPVATAKPVGPEPAPATPREKTPAMKAAIPPASGAGDQKGWLSSHKGLAILVAVAGGGAVAALAAGGGGGSSSGPAPAVVPDFPPPPNR